MRKRKKADSPKKGMSWNWLSWKGPVVPPESIMAYDLGQLGEPILKNSSGNGDIIWNNGVEILC